MRVFKGRLDAFFKADIGFFYGIGTDKRAGNGKLDIFFVFQQIDPALPVLKFISQGMCVTQLLCVRIHVENIAADGNSGKIFNK